MRCSAIIALVAVPLFFYHHCSAQRSKIDSLEKVLPILRDSARIDCLNELSVQHIQNENKKSAEDFANLALSDAEKINYIHGVAVALSRQSQIAKHFDDDFIKSELLGKESLSWYERTANKEGLDNLYSYLIYTVFSQSKFEEAIDYAEKEYALAKQTGKKETMAEAFAWYYAIYRQSGDYEKAFSYAQQRFDLAMKSKNKFWLSQSYYSMAQLYELIEDYPSALMYFRKVIETDDAETRNDRITTDNDIWFKMEFSEAFSHLHQFDSAWHYYNLFKPPPNKAVYLRVWWVSSGECYYLQRNYEHALQNFRLGLAEHRKLNDRNEVMRTLLDMGKAYMALNNNEQAHKFGKEGLALALQARSKQFIRDGYLILSTVYDRLNEKDSANFYFRQYTIMKEEVLNDQTKAKFAAYKYEQQIALINSQKTIVDDQLKIQKQKLQQESLERRILLIGLISVFVIGVFIVRTIYLKRRNERQRLKQEMALQKVEAEKEKLELKQRSAELEMQALRAQMNPHFIFNSLNSINMFILENNKLQASEYLYKFSRLVRLILQNSQEAFIPLERELEALKLYLELESVRFDKKFEYRIVIDDMVDTTVLTVPPLIIQPYAENAIWHGLMHKKQQRHLEIELFQKGDVLNCKITDDGVGRAEAEQLKSKSQNKHKSVGIKITESRIAMTQLSHSAKSVEIRDLTYPDGSAAGTEVTVKIPVYTTLT